MDYKFMREAIKLANDNIKNGGGPFAAIIVKDDKIVGRGANQVTNHIDPTAHAEILAIRDASKNLNTIDLADCTLYTTCEPCPMCFGAIYWSHISKVFYGNSKEDAANIGFDDDFIYKELELSKDKRKLKMVSLLRDEAIETFKEWDNMPNKREY